MSVPGHNQTLTIAATHPKAMKNVFCLLVWRTLWVFHDLHDVPRWPGSRGKRQTSRIRIVSNHFHQGFCQLVREASVFVGTSWKVLYAELDVFHYDRINNNLVWCSTSVWLWNMSCIMYECCCMGNIWRTGRQCCLFLIGFYIEVNGNYTFNLMRQTRQSYIVQCIVALTLHFIQQSQRLV